MPVILATQEAEIRRIAIQSQPRQIVGKTLSRKPYNKKLNWWSGSKGPKFKPSTTKKKKKENTKIKQPTQSYTAIK
jgi:hypothetical protein